jgi:hypothetical protein
MCAGAVLAQLDTMHYAVAKSLSEVKAHKANIEELRELIQEFAQCVDEDVADYHLSRLHLIDTRYKHASVGNGLPH